MNGSTKDKFLDEVSINQSVPGGFPPYGKGLKVDDHRITEWFGLEIMNNFIFEPARTIKHRTNGTTGIRGS